MGDSILALETSTPQASLAVWRDGGLVREEVFVSERSHNARLFAPLRRALLAAGDLRCLVVGTGPGSYAGVRVGIAAALGISLANNVPLIGWPSLLAVDGDGYAIVGDARRSTWHFSAVHGGRLDGPYVGDAQETAARCAAHAGKILTFDAVSPAFCQAESAIPSAVRLVEIVARLPHAEIVRLAAQPVEPLYLAEPFVTSPKLRPPVA
ncbi:MAG: tRNA (adenosine(37)-N6)-threonylcarbamoyltransferase complex dimerization subunit type 1 TsaB [Verrucomicrobiales bacterium]|nr:tRNA (adenosine(37)-N6)-threonylcarbamoyltransferase complex dimerization subunit type 1 TsaB [Verrucomicrobiales bacterium]